jgi:hypothetical protein
MSGMVAIFVDDGGQARFHIMSECLGPDDQPGLTAIRSYRLQNENYSEHSAT